jgi:hypothetical protein
LKKWFDPIHHDTIWESGFTAWGNSAEEELLERLLIDGGIGIERIVGKRVRRAWRALVRYIRHEECVGGKDPLGSHGCDSSIRPRLGILVPVMQG